MAKVAIPVGADFEDSEFTVSRDRLREAGHSVTVFGAKAGETLSGKQKQATARIEKSAGDLEAEDFDALVIPGGHSPDELRTDEDVVSFVKRFGETGKPIAAVCHGPQLLIEADLVDGRTVTSWPSVRKDLENAGAKWIDREVVEDGNLITSRKPDDMGAFCTAILRRLDGGAEQQTAKRARG